MNNQILEIIKRAGRTHSVLRIIYIEKDGTSEGWRYIEPYSFCDYGKSEALFAWDIQREGIRRFILHRIDNAELTERVFSPRYSIEII